MSEKIPVVALVGAPNVGKSTLFNAIIGERKAITGSLPGTTRDRAYGEAVWNGKKFMLIDTGGLSRKSGDPLETNIRKQAELGILEADVLVLLADSKAPTTGSVTAAKEIKEVLRKNKKLNALPVFVVANKVDSAKQIEASKQEFKKLGLGEVLSISAITGRGVGDLLDAITESFPKTIAENDRDVYATVAIVGRPNAGKSTLTNHFAGEERVIVSPVPGTTRTAVGIDIKYKDKLLHFIDTAGMRRRAKIDLDVEEYSLFQAIRSIEQSDVVILMLDADGGPARFEQTIGGRLKESSKGIVIAINKIDLLEDEKALAEVEDSIRHLYPFLRFAKIIPISAKTGQNTDKLLKAVIEAKESRDLLIPDEDLEKSIKTWVAKFRPNKLRNQKTPKVFGLRQMHANPPTFSLIVNDPKAIHFSYVRFLENQIRAKYGFEGTAIRIKARKPQT